MKAKTLLAAVMVALTAVMALSPLSAVAANSAPQSVPMKKVKYDRHKQDTDIDGRRAPAKSVMCVISGEYRIVVTTVDYCYIGYISTL